MFGSHYFGPRYFGAGYFGGASAPPESATAYTLVGPTTSRAGRASAPIFLEANADPAELIVVTLSDGGAGGSFVPATTVAFAPGVRRAIVHYSAPAPGSYTIASTNDGGLDDPGPIVIQARSKGKQVVWWPSL